MRVMVTGTGFIGSHVAQALLQNGDEVVFYGFFESPEAISDVVDLSKLTQVKGDVLDINGLERAVRENGVEGIVHTAAILIAGAREDPLNAVRTNVLGTANVLEVSRRAGVRKIVYTSSGQVYAMLNPYVEAPKPASGYVGEDDLVLPGSVYGTTKAACEYLGMNYADLYGIGFIALRLPTVYGCWLGPMGLAGVIRNICEKAVKGEELEVNEYRSEWAYVKDVAKACTLAVHSEKVRKGVFNIGTGRINSLREAVDIVRREVGDVKIVVKDVKAPERYPADISKAMRELGYSPNYDFEAGVKEILGWVRRHLKKEG